MPLRDHFHPPLTFTHSWDEVHGSWPTKLVEYLLVRLPQQYRAAPSVHLGSQIEIDQATFDRGESGWQDSGGGVATLPFIPLKPSFAVEYDDLDEYEVRIVDDENRGRLVAAIEIVSPANKDRATHRKTFVSKCQALLRSDVSVIIVDIVTNREGNLFHELRREMGLPTAAEETTGPYAVACRSVPSRSRRQLQAWEAPLAVGGRLPVLPLWLSDTLALELDFEVRVLRRACGNRPFLLILSARRGAR